MKQKINIAQLLKDCPQGMELDCLMFENVYFDKVSDDKKAYYPILCYITDEKGNRSSISFTKNGCESIRYGAKCVIFPKGKTTWEGFHRPFKDGDIVATSNGLWIGITTGGECGRLIPTYCVITNYGAFEAYLDRKESWQFHRLATEEEKEKLFDAIKTNGYKWNAETKTLEKLPKFNVGDRIVDIYRKHLHCDSASGEISQITDDKYIFDDGSYIHIQCQDNWELAPNKFDITTLKPFDKVLVRNKSNEVWTANFYSHYDATSDKPFICVGWSEMNEYRYCIPYEVNNELLGTTNNTEEYGSR